MTGKVKEYEPFIRKHAGMFWNRYQHLPFDDVLFEAIKIAMDFEARLWKPELDYVWLDEEPPIDIYTEALTRTNVGANPVWLTFTPLQGVSTLVNVSCTGSQTTDTKW